jgi:hypothetical protein
MSYGSCWEWRFHQQVSEYWTTQGFEFTESLALSSDAVVDLQCLVGAACRLRELEIDGTAMSLGDVEAIGRMGALRTLRITKGSLEDGVTDHGVEEELRRVVAGRVQMEVTEQFTPWLKGVIL